MRVGQLQIGHEIAHDESNWKAAERPYKFSKNYNQTFSVKYQIYYWFKSL